MKALAWIRTAGGALLKGAAGWQVYAGVALASVLLVGAVLWWFNSRIDAAFDAGQKAAAQAAAVQALTGEVNTLRNLATANKESNDAIAKDLERLGAMGARVDELERVRRADLARFERLVGRATEPALRAHAGAAERDIAAVERSRDGFAQEAVRASTAAWGHRDTLQARRDAIRAQRDGARPQPKE